MVEKPKPPEASSDVIPSVSPAEWEVMEVFWERGEMAARDVFDALPEDCEWAYKTVKTLLSRLVAKGALDYKQVGNSYLYRAAYSRHDLTRDEVRTFVDRVFGGAVAPLLTYFAQEKNLTDEDMEQLRRIVGDGQDKAEGKDKS